MPVSAFQPVDYEATDAAVLTIPTALREAGDIWYRVKPLSYREQYSHDNGAYQQITAVVDWREANDFVDFTLGYTEWVRTDATRLHRVLPMQSPYQETMYADNIESGMYSVRQGRGIRAGANVNHWPDADDLEYTVTFRTRLYDMLTDEEVDSSAYPWAAYGCKELGRYVQRIPTPRVEELKLGTYGLEADNPASPGTWNRPIPQVGFIPFVRTDVVYIWYQVPEDAVPQDAIDNCGGKVNDTAFDKKRNVADTAWVDRWAAGTLLFKGVAQELSPHTGPNGERLVDVYYAFSRQEKTWNKFPPPDPTSADWWPVRRKGVAGNAPLYASADFRTLFKPRTT